MVKWYDCPNAGEITPKNVSKSILHVNLYKGTYVTETDIQSKAVCAFYVEASGPMQGMYFLYHLTVTS